MTVKELRQLLMVLKQSDIGCLSIEEVNSLISTIEVEAYVQQVKDFKKFVDDLMSFDNDDEKAWDAFYDLKWTITFGNHSVTIGNEATIYNAMQDFLADFVENCL